MNGILASVNAGNNYSANKTVKSIVRETGHLTSFLEHQNQYLDYYYDQNNKMNCTDVLKPEVVEVQSKDVKASVHRFKKSERFQDLDFSLVSDTKLYNVAPMCNVSCQKGSARNVQNLVQSQAINRNKNHTWLHNFTDNDNVFLEFSLPCYVLLTEIHLHAAAPLAFPSGVALNLGGNNVFPWLAVTSLQSPLVITLPTPTIVNNVKLQLFKPVNSNNIGLSQVELIGTTFFKGLYFRLFKIS